MTDICRLTAVINVLWNVRCTMIWTSYSVSTSRVSSAALCSRPMILTKWKILLCSLCSTFFRKKQTGIVWVLVHSPKPTSTKWWRSTEVGLGRHLLIAGAWSHSATLSADLWRLSSLSVCVVSMNSASTHSRYALAAGRTCCPWNYISV